MNSPFPASSLTNECDTDVSADLATANALLVLLDRAVLGEITIEAGVNSEITECASIPIGAVNCGSDLVLPSISAI